MPRSTRSRACCRSGACRDVHGGVSLWIELDAPLSSALVMDVRSRGLLLSAGPRFSVDGGHDRHLRIPFTAPPDELVRAVGILAEAWPRVRSGAPVAIVEQWDSGSDRSERSPREAHAVDGVVGRPELAQVAERPRLGAWNRRAR